MYFWLMLGVAMGIECVCQCAFCVRGPVIFFDSLHAWEDTKVTIWVPCVSIHRHMPHITTHHICHFLLCLYKCLARWGLIPGCFLLSGPFALHPRLYNPPTLPVLLFFLSIILCPLPFFNVFLFVDSLLAFIGLNNATKRFTNN